MNFLWKIQKYKKYYEKCDFISGTTDNCNNCRKLQRGNDDYSEQVESLQLQIEHLQTR